MAPDDGPAKVMLARIEAFAAQPTAADWDGTWNLDEK